MTDDEKCIFQIAPRKKHTTLCLQIISIDLYINNKDTNSPFEVYVVSLVVQMERCLPPASLPRRIHCQQAEKLRLIHLRRVLRQK